MPRLGAPLGRWYICIAHTAFRWERLHYLAGGFFFEEYFFHFLLHRAACGRRRRGGVQGVLLLLRVHDRPLSAHIYICMTLRSRYMHVSYPTGRSTDERQQRVLPIS